MRIPRLFVDQALTEHSDIQLNDQASHYLSKVLRLKEQSPLIVFNNRGGEYSAHIDKLNKKSLQLHIGEHQKLDRLSDLQIHLGIGISKGDRFDWALQKATELGVTSISPLFTERTEIKLKADRAEKKLAHWRQVTISASEQCQRNRLPNIHPPQTLDQWLEVTDADKKWVLHHRSPEALSPADKLNSAALLIGPEGGLSEEEIAVAIATGFSALSLGPRVLRTETAPIAAITLLQFHWGDL